MKINKISMAIIAAASVLAVCPAVHAQATDTNNATAATPAPRARGGGMTIEAIDKVVTLTDAEKPKVKAALEEMTTAMTAARSADQSERRTKMTAAREELDKKMKDILTPEQYTKYQAMPRGGRRAGGAGGGNAPAN